MDRRSACYAAAAVALVAAFQTAEPHVGRAYASARGEVCWDLPDSLVDWTAVATGALRASREPPEALLRQHYSEIAGSSDIPFEVPPTAAVTAKAWHVVFDTTIVELRSTRLRGTARFEVDSAFRLTGPRTFFGKACARDHRFQMAAFVVNAAPGSRWTAEKGVVRRVAERRWSVEFRGSTHTIGMPRFAGDSITRATVFTRPGAAALWLVRWKTGFCESAYSLFSITPGGTTKQVGENGYHCDV